MTQALRLLLLGGWSGAMMVWSLVVIPATFAALPGTELAARIVGSTLDRLDQSGIFLALATCALGLIGARANGGWTSRAALLWALFPLVPGVCHALSLLWVSPTLVGLRASAGGSVTRMTIDDPNLTRFGHMHTLSTSLFAFAAVCVLAVALWDLARTVSRLRKSTPTFRENP